MTNMQYQGQGGEQHPPEWRQDLNPSPPMASEAAKDAPTAYELKALHDRLQGYSDDELKQIPVLPEGTRLEQGATYIDLRESQGREFTATGNMVAGPDNWYVPKREVDYQLWNRLIGVREPERLGQADGS